MRKTPFKNKPQKPLKRSPFKRTRVRTKNPVKSTTAPRKPKPKASRIKTLKKKLWTAFSRYIRSKNADHQGNVVECDTGATVPWQSTHCGHLFANTERNQQLGGNELWYYENNFAPQNGQGNTFNVKDSAKQYMLWAIKKYGLDEVEKMKRMKQTYRLWTEEELLALLEKYSGTTLK